MIPKRTGSEKIRVVIDMVELSGRLRALRHKLGIEEIIREVEALPSTQAKPPTPQASENIHEPDPQSRLSKRLEVLLLIHRYQSIHGHGIRFTELKEISGFTHGTVSKCHDSLSDMGITSDVWRQGEDGKWAMVLELDNDGMAFAELIIRQLNKIGYGEAMLKLQEANVRLHRKDGKKHETE